MTGPVLVHEDGAAVARSAAEWIAASIEAAVGERNMCSVALAGGGTPRETFEVLGGTSFDRLPWDRVSWFFGDERAVPPHHVASNYRMVVETLFRSRPRALDRVFRMPAEAADADLAAREYGRLLPDPMDLVILGMGEDGHIASIFPGSPTFDEGAMRVAMVTGPKVPPRRMTVTPSVIELAREVVLLVTGDSKAAVLARALEGDASVRDVPARLARRGTWILDRKAASLLTTVR